MVQVAMGVATVGDKISHVSVIIESGITPVFLTIDDERWLLFVTFDPIYVTTNMTRVSWLAKDITISSILLNEGLNYLYLWIINEQAT